MLKSISAVLVSLILIGSAANAETYCTASALNGRSRPDRASSIEARFEYGDEIELTGKKHGDWLEAVGGESGTVWVWNEYVSERLGTSKWKNTSGGRVRVRKEIGDGKTTAWVKAGKTVKVKTIRDGWGETNQGWIDLSYFEEVDN